MGRRISRRFHFKITKERCRILRGEREVLRAYRATADGPVLIEVWWRYADWPGRAWTDLPETHWILGHRSEPEIVDVEDLKRRIQEKAPPERGS